MLKVRWQVLMLVACLLALFGTQTLAQETTPFPEETPVVTSTEDTVIPTEIPTETPTAPPVIETTPEATVEPPLEQTAEPPVPPTATPVVPGLPPEPVLALLVREMFDTGDLSNWVYGPTWTVAANETGLGLQTSAADVLQLNRGPFASAAAQISLKLTGGSIHLALGQSAVGSYSAALDAAGLVTLYRAGVPVQSVTVTLPPETWHTLRLSLMDGVLRVAVNVVEVITWQDTAPLPPGMMAVLAYPPADGAPFIVQVDNAFVWVPETDVSLYPPPTPVPTTPPVEPTLEPTAVATNEPTAEVTALPTADATAEPTAEITPIVEPTAELTPEVTAEPTQEVTPVVDPVTGKSLALQMYVPPSGAQASTNNEPVAARTVSPIPFYSWLDLVEPDNTDTDDTTGENNLALPCGFNITATVWYRFQPAATKKYIISTEGSAFDTILVVYPDNGSGSGPAPQPAPPQPPNNTVGCNDDATATNLTSKLTLTLTGGLTYWIRLGGYNGEHGNYRLAVQEAVLPIPYAPRLSSPATNTFGSAGVQTFQWLPPLTGAAPAHYEIQISRASTFTTLVHSRIISPPDDSPPGTPPPTTDNYTFTSDGVYYWRMRSLNANFVGGAWAAARKLIVGPAGPTLKSPADLSVTNLVRPTLSWNAVSGAVRYRVQLQEKGSTTQLLLPNKNVVTTTSMALSTLVMQHPLQHGKTYEWNVVAIDAATNETPASDTWEFTVNLMKTPTDGQAVVAPVAARPTFTWQAAGFTGVKYVLEVADEDTFADPLLYQSLELATTSHTLPVGEELPNGERYYWRLRVLNHPLPPIPTEVPERSLLVTASLPGAVLLEKPTNAKLLGGVTPTLAVEFGWKAATNAVQYQFQLATNTTFTAGFEEFIIPSPPPPNLPSLTVVDLAQGLYYWRVRALNADGAPGGWSAVWRFTADTTPSAPPTLKSPANLSVTNLVRPTLSWNRITGAARYRVHLQLKGTTDQLLLPNKDVVTTTSMALSTLVMQSPLQHGKTYEWSVIALDAAGNESIGNDTWEFTVNLMKAPADNIGIRVLAFPGSPTFTWYAAGVTGATYRVEVSTIENDFSTAKSCTTAALYCALPSLPTDQRLTGPNTYYWRLLVVVGGSDQHPNVPVRSFAASTSLPGTPVLTSPATGTSHNLLPTLKWSGPTGTFDHYELQMSSTSTFTLPLAHTDTIPFGTTSYSGLPALTDGTYWWRVRAVNSDGAGGAWSAARSFVFDTTAPTGDALKPTLLTPANRSYFTGTQPRFTWRVVPGYTRYEIQLVTTGDCTNPLPLVFPVNTTSFTPPGPLLYTDYRWCVRVVDAAGNKGDWSNPFEVKVISASNAVPVLNRFDTTNTPTLTWTPISWADQYEVQISYNSTFTSLVPNASAFVPPTPGTNPPTTYTTPELANGTYYWRVRAHDPGSTIAPTRPARWGNWSPLGPSVYQTGTFQIDYNP